MTPAEIRAWTERSRASSGLQPKIEDSAVLARLVTLAFSGTQAREGEGDDSTP